MYKLTDLLTQIKDTDASDLHLCVGLPPIMRVNGALQKMHDAELSRDDMRAFAKETLEGRDVSLDTHKEIDLAYEVPNMARFRVNVYEDLKGPAIAFRLIPNEVRTLSDLGLPPVVETICSAKKGLVLVTGITGSGKSTTLTSIIDKINSERKEHIISIEDPVEFIYSHKSSIVNQKEVGEQTASFAGALRGALREDPDVILVGEMRDLETVAMIMTSAETGHLVFSTLHTSGAAQTIDRIIDVFPPHQQNQIRIQLADVLTMVVSQVLLPSVDGNSRHLASEIMVNTKAIKNLIRESQTHQIYSAIQAGGALGMQTLDSSLKALVDSGKVAKEVAVEWAIDKDTI